MHTTPRSSVAGLRDGDPDAAAHVVRLVGFVIRDRAWAIPPRDRPDVTQQVLIDVWRALVEPDFNFAGELDTLVRTVAYRRCVDWMRRQRPTEAIEEEVEDEATRAWMAELYRARLAGASTAETVRQASVRVLGARRAAGLSTHPFYWGAFVAAGDWR